MTTEHNRRTTDLMAAEILQLKFMLKQFEWQPIETAPKDGEEILIMSGLIHDVGVCYWRDDSIMTGWTWGLEQLFGNAKYWMPLPPPPTIDKQGE